MILLQVTMKCSFLKITAIPLALSATILPVSAAGKKMNVLFITDPLYSKVVAEMKALLKKVHPVPVEGGKAVNDTKTRYCD
jgi:hypothetical protein